MEKISLLVKRTEASKNLPLPQYMTSGASGLDLFASTDHNIRIEPGKFKSIPTGISAVIPDGYEAQIRPRSGLALKYGITVLNSPGTIDADYRGEINIILINLGENDFVIEKGDRIAQLVINKVIHAELIVVDYLPESDRGINGFGSTGV
jgi:dUTP pyrophosphatase